MRPRPEQARSRSLRRLQGRPQVLLILLAATLLGGCASLRPASAVWPVLELPTSWESRRDLLQSWQHFEMSGRLALAAGDEGLVANLNWQQRAERTDLGLSGPAGIGTRHWRFERGEDARIARSLEEVLGFELPVAAARYWLLGVPDPASPASVQLESEASRLSELVQLGWQVRYLAYAPVPGTRFELPARIEIRRDAWRVRLIVNDWRAGTR